MLELFHPLVREWFHAAFAVPTRAQRLSWPAIARGESVLLLAPTGSGKTLAAFLWCLDRLLFSPAPPPANRCRVLYVSPLKALAADVDRNLRRPLAEIAALAKLRAVDIAIPEIAVRTGDTPARDRARFQRNASDILITTPESLFLLLTSAARGRLAAVDTVIVDEIHALVPGKRGAHLALSLERLEALRAAPTGRRLPLQRIGLSATQRPLDEAARFLGGAETHGMRRPSAAGAPQRRPGPLADVPIDEFVDRATEARYRPVTIVDASERKALDLRIEVPIEDMARLGSPPGGATTALAVPDPPAAGGAAPPGRPSIWTSIYPRLLEHIRAHGSTLVFVNSRRLAERLAAALNELADEPIVRAHHGSLARGARTEIEELLKAGRIRALVATSSLELGIDMAAIDLVIQIEAPPSVASGLQRIGRGGHQAGATSAGIIFPKFRGDLVACAAVARAMQEGDVEPIRYPRNPLDVLAQQVVAMTAMDAYRIDDLFALVRRAAPFAGLSRATFEGVLDMLSGRYPSDQFAELRPRITWNRTRGTVVARAGARRVAVANAGTIPDRGLYGVFLAGAGRPVRVGELDEEMVFETPVGDTFTLGASTWRVEDITHDRVFVRPAPGEPGKMPFWHGDRPGRPVELGRAIGRLVRELRHMPRAAAIERLSRTHALDMLAAENLVRYLGEQAAAGAVPDDRTIVVERCLDDLGDWRVCVLSPLGSRVHAPWAIAVRARIRQQVGIDVDVLWGDDGFVVRFGEVARAPDPRLLLPEAAEALSLVVGELGATSLFAARFRETAARALLLPRRRPGRRTPLWQQRKRATSLLAVASRFGSFPALLETYRELLRDHFDMPALSDTLRRVAAGDLRVITIDSGTPSPFAASLLFNYVAAYLYDGDAPLAERRAQALSVDQSELRELIGDAELRELLDPDAFASIERELQHLDPAYRARSADDVHDLLLQIGDLTPAELAARTAGPDVQAAIGELVQASRVLDLSIAGERRLIAVEDAARYRDALGVALPPGIPEALLAPVPDPARDLVRRFARSHAAFTAGDLARRFGLGTDAAGALLSALTAEGALVEGEFRPGGTAREWVDAGVLRRLRRKSLAALRHEAEPVEPDAFGRLLVAWHGIGMDRRGVDALLDAIEQLQGAPIPASVLERDVLPLRVRDYAPAMLDTLMAAGEVAWIGVSPLGERDGRIALYLTSHLPALCPPAPETPRIAGRAGDIVEYLRRHGASFFGAVHEGTGGGFPQETIDALWALVWQGAVTNDTLHALRVYIGRPGTSRRRHGHHRQAAFQSRRLTPPAAEGRWSLVPGAGSVEDAARRHQRGAQARAAQWAAATARQLLARYGIVTRETVMAEAVAGGFTAVYQALGAMEHAGRIRRGYFVAGLGGAQFALPEAVERLRALREPPAAPRQAVLAATDPGNPYGAVLRWPEIAEPVVADAPPPASAGQSGRAPARTAGAMTVLVDGRAAAYLRRGERELLLFRHLDDARFQSAARCVARALLERAGAREDGRRGMLLTHINGVDAVGHPAAPLFVEEGFIPTAMGLQARVRPDLPSD